jgi:hypothetical protein
MELAIQNGRLVTGREGVVVVDVVIYIFLERFPSLLTDCLPPLCCYSCSCSLCFEEEQTTTSFGTGRIIIITHTAAAAPTEWNVPASSSRGLEKSRTGKTPLELQTRAHKEEEPLLFWFLSGFSFLFLS